MYIHIKQYKAGAECLPLLCIPGKDAISIAMKVARVAGNNIVNA
jgi:hypothetical protein